LLDYHITTMHTAQKQRTRDEAHLLPAAGLQRDREMESNKRHGGGGGGGGGGRGVAAAGAVFAPPLKKSGSVRGSAMSVSSQAGPGSEVVGQVAFRSTRISV
jgi:hypothetical protein